jgi:hypothetical protein
VDGTAVRHPGVPLRGAGIVVVAFQRVICTRVLTVEVEVQVVVDRNAADAGDNRRSERGNFASVTGIELRDFVASAVEIEVPVSTSQQIRDVRVCVRRRPLSVSVDIVLSDFLVVTGYVEVPRSVDSDRPESRCLSPGILPVDGAGISVELRNVISCVAVCVDSVHVPIVVDIQRVVIVHIDSAGIPEL